jgi:hypothetical protein
MSQLPHRIEEATLRRLARVKHTEAPVSAALGPEMLAFFKHSVSRRQAKFAKIADVWGRLVPQTLADHCALESFTRGSLTVIVDSSSYLYELKQLLLAGLQQQLLLACNSAGLRKITLRPGRWYEGDTPDGRRPSFV